MIKIMTGLPCFIILLSILLTGVNRVTGRTYQGRIAYDLQNGPVTYEAYYPDDPSETPIDQRQQLMEQSYQTYNQYPPSINKNKLFDNDYITLYQRPPPPPPPPSVYSQQIDNIERSSNPIVEDALKILIDAIRAERSDTLPSIGKLYLREPLNNEENERIDASIDYQRANANNYQAQRQINHFSNANNKDNGINGINGINEGNTRDNSMKSREKPQVSSIEVSEKPHKIRHHHGDKMRRNRSSSSDHSNEN